MDQIRNVLDLLNPFINLIKLNRIDKIDTFKRFEQKTRIKFSQITVVLAFGIIFFAASFFVNVSNILTWFFCYFFPAYFTLIALRDGKKDVYTRYLIYWVTYPALIQLQPVIKMFFNKTIFNTVRVIFTILLLNPRFDVGTKFFESVLKPLLQNEKIRAITVKINNGDLVSTELKKQLKAL